ncbi:MAG: GNAT family N-acetyltransferase [Candidatus Niameybacter stercoravium]|nr:GNAT family N-acetyltransferase [Candidatus Niameybacter stercoravium]
MKINFIKANKEDAGFIRSLFTNGEYELYFAENDTTTEEWEERFKFYDDMCNRLIIDTDTGEKIGWLLYDIEDEICKIHLIVLRYELIGKAFGYWTLRALENLVVTKAKYIILDVQQRNTRAVRFYEKFGFKIVSEEKQVCGNAEELYYNMKYDFKIGINEIQ